MGKNVKRISGGTKSYRLQLDEDTDARLRNWARQVAEQAGAAPSKKALVENIIRRLAREWWEKQNQTDGPRAA